MKSDDSVTGLFDLLNHECGDRTKLNGTKCKDKLRKGNTVTCLLSPCQNY